MRRVLSFGSLCAAALVGAVGSRALAPRPADAEPVAGLVDFSAAAARAAPAVVQVQSYLSRPRDLPSASDRGPTDESLGSGFLVSSDGVIVTSAHVVAAGSAIYVHVLDRGWLEARVLGTDPVVDVAVLKVEAAGLPALAVGDPARLRVGQWVMALGSPYRLPRSLTVGVVSGLHRSDVGTPNPFEDYIQTDAAMNVGSSGGPLLDADGRVVGVGTAILSRTVGNQGLSFAVPIDVVMPAVDAIRSGRAMKRLSLGANVRDVAAREAIGVPGGAGQVVTRLSEDSPARRAGLAEGDVILDLDGVATPSRGILLRTLWGKRAGSQVTLKVWRRGQTLLVPVVPVER
jgi:serine protease Do